MTRPSRADADGNQSVAVSVAVLEALASAGRPVGVTELARLLGESKGRTHRHLSTLRALGLVSQDEASDRYLLGWKTYRLGMAAAENFSLARIAARHLARLRDELQQTTALAIPAGDDAIVIASVPSDNPITLHVKHGWVVSSNASALGRVILAFAPALVQKRALARPLRRFEGGAITDPGTLARRLAVVRRRFYDTALNETAYGIGAIAAPVFDEHDVIAGAVAVVGSPQHVKAPPPKAMLKAVQGCAAAISRELDSRAWQKR